MTTIHDEVQNEATAFTSRIIQIMVGRLDSVMADVKVSAKSGIAKAARKRCIAKNCKQPSRGPRFRYLCVKHNEASEKQVEAWKK